MIFLPYKKIKVITDMPATEVELSLMQHIQQSKVKSWFFTMTDDYAISGRKKGDVFYIKKRYSNASNKVKVKVSSSNVTMVELTIYPGIWQFVPPLFLLVFLGMLSFLFTGFAYFFLIVIVIFYLLAVMRVVFDSWWFEDLLKKKILVKELRYLPRL